VTREVAEGPGTATGEPMYGLIETTTKTTATPLSAGTLVLDGTGSVIGLVTGRAAPTPTTPPPTRPANRTTTRATAGDQARLTASAAADSDSNTQHYAIPADFAWNVAAQLADTRHVVQPWVGLPGGEDITAEEADREGITGGMRVTLIETSSPASAELQHDDIVVALEKDNVTGYNAFVTALRRYPVGSYVTLRVLRRGAYDSILLRVAGKVEK
jgi:S1-C subfamily serine protease